MGKRILLGGATGVVGQGVVRVLLQCDQVEAVSVLVSRPFTALDPRAQALQLTDYSTTRWTVWTCAAWTPACIAADRGYSECRRPPTSRRLWRPWKGVIVGHAAANPAGYVSFISGMAADPGSRMMPLQVKGQAEQVLARSGLAHTSLHPGVLRPVLGVASPHRLRRGLYAVGRSPVLAPAAGICPQVFTSTEAIRRCLPRLVINRLQRPDLIKNADIAQQAG